MMPDRKIIFLDEQLNDLPAGTILRDRDGDAWQKQRDGESWCVAGEGAALCEADFVARFSPLQVLWEEGVDDKAE